MNDFYQNQKRQLKYVQPASLPVHGYHRVTVLVCQLIEKTL